MKLYGTGRIHTWYQILYRPVWTKWFSVIVCICTGVLPAAAGEDDGGSVGGLMPAVRSSMQQKDAEAPFPCHESLRRYVPGVITTAAAAARGCFVDLPCEYSVGCCGGQMPPTYSAPRFHAITESHAHHLERTLLWPPTKTKNKTFVHQFPMAGTRYRSLIPSCFVLL